MTETTWTINLFYPIVLTGLFGLVGFIGYLIYRYFIGTLFVNDKKDVQNIFERMFNKATTDNKDMFNKMVDYNKSIRFTVAHELELHDLEQTLSELILTLQDKGLIEKEKPQDELGQ